MSLPLQKVIELIDKHAELEKDLSSSNLDNKCLFRNQKSIQV